MAAVSDNLGRGHKAARIRGQKQKRSVEIGHLTQTALRDAADQSGARVRRKEVTVQIGQA